MGEGRAYRVGGRVQGVGFRWWTLRTARRLGLTGDVRNREDGSVEVRAWGTSGKLDDLERSLSSGPPGAQVSEVARLDSPTDSAPADFRIRR